MSTEEKRVVVPQLIRSLSADVKATEGVISEARETMMRRRKDNCEYYQPAWNLNESIKRTRVNFKRKVNETLELIRRETEELREIQAITGESTAEVRRTAEEIREKPSIVDESPVMVSVRAMAAMLPFVAFTLFNFCNRGKLN